MLSDKKISALHLLDNDKAMGLESVVQFFFVKTKVVYL